jgi:hypothetical protein
MMPFKRDFADSSYSVTSKEPYDWKRSKLWEYDNVEELALGCVCVLGMLKIEENQYLKLHWSKVGSGHLEIIWKMRNQAESSAIIRLNQIDQIWVRNEIES